MKVKRIETDTFDVECLACAIMGLDIDEIDYEGNEVEEKLYEHFEIDLCNFKEIICRLLPLIDFGKSPLTKKKFKGFAKIEIEANEWLVKTEV